MRQADVVALPASGVSDESIGTDSTPLAGKPREVEQGGEPDEDADASQLGLFCLMRRSPMMPRKR